MAVSYNEMNIGGSQKKKKKQPSMAQAQGQQDPLVTAIAGGATGGGFGANNQAANMAPGVGGNVGGVDTSTTTATPSQGVNTPPAMPPPPPPPLAGDANNIRAKSITTTNAPVGSVNNQAFDSPQNADARQRSQFFADQASMGNVVQDELPTLVSNTPVAPSTPFSVEKQRSQNYQELAKNPNLVSQNAAQLQEGLPTNISAGPVAPGKNMTPTNMPDPVAPAPLRMDQFQATNQKPGKVLPSVSNTDLVNSQNADREIGTGRPIGADGFSPGINPESGQPANMAPLGPEFKQGPPSGIDEVSETPIDPITKAINNTSNPTSDPNFGRPPATTVNPTSDPNFGQAPATTVNPTSDPNFSQPPATTVNPTSDPNFGKPPATTVNPTSDPNFGKPPATTVNPTSDPNFSQPPATTVNPISDPGFVSDLATGQPITENPLSDPLAVRAMEEERMSQPVTENPLSDPSFVQGLAADATTPTVNPISDPSFVQGLAADATTPTDALGAGADMAAAQNVVTPEAAPMADTLEDALRQQYMNRVGGTDDPIMASQLADQQFRQNEARKALVEQLGRYGVLRGGGDTAAALARMGEGDERNRLALEAQAAQRRQQDLRDAQGFDLGQRGMGLQETRSQQDTLTQALNRDIARAGQTGIFERDETMAAKRQSAELDALSRGQERADAALTGEFGEDGQQTLQAQRQQAELFGELDDQKTLAGQQLESQLFGEVDDRQTLTGETTQSGLDTQDLQRRIAEAGQTGLFDTGAANMAPVETQQARALESELDTAALRRDATRAGLTGEFEDDPTLEAELRRAGMTGMLGDETTLAGRQAEQDLIGSILAGTDIDDPRLDPLLQSLTDRLGEGGLFTEENRQAFEDRLGLGEIPELPEYPLSAENKDEFEDLQTKLTNFDRLPEKDKRRMADMRQEMVEKMRELSDPNNSPYIQDLLRKEEQGGPLLPQERRRLMEVRNRLGTGE
jgi:hypothetical protein